jgi:hypothetical protein
MRNVLIVSPHFPTDNAADMQRVRMYGPLWADRPPVSAAVPRNSYANSPSIWPMSISQATARICGDAPAKSASASREGLRTKEEVVDPLTGHRPIKGCPGRRRCSEHPHIVPVVPNTAAKLPVFA